MAGSPSVPEDETGVSIAYPSATNTVTLRRYDSPAVVVGNWDWPAEPKRKDSRHKPFWHSLPRGTRNKRR